MDSVEAKKWAAGCHGVAILGMFVPCIGGLLAPLFVFLYWIWLRATHPLIEKQGRESLNFQITMSLMGLLNVFLYCIGGIGFFTGIIIAIIDLGFVIFAMQQVLTDQDFKYPFTLRPIKKNFL